MQESWEKEVNPVDRIIGEWEKERPDLDVSPLDIFGRIARINLILGRTVNEFLAEYDLSVGLFDVLTALRRVGAPYKLKPSDLAELTMLSSGGMTGRLDHLVELGYVRRATCDQDRRVMFAELTPEGIQITDMLIEVHFDREDKFLDGLQGADQSELLRILKSLEDAMTKQPASSVSEG